MRRVQNHASPSGASWDHDGAREDHGAEAEKVFAGPVQRAEKSERGQRWSTFLRNHMNVTVACDFFAVPTLFFKTLFCFVVLSHDRRRILHVNVTRDPTAGWVARQIFEAVPGDGDKPRFLVRHPDRVYDDGFVRQMKRIGLREVPIQPKSPWQNPYCDGVVGALRRECTDQVILLGEKHLLRVLGEYIDPYYNVARPHLSLDRNASIPRVVQPRGLGEVQGCQVLGGLHHRHLYAT